MYGLLEMDGSKFTVNTTLPLNIALNLLIIRRGIVLPSTSFTLPLCIGCLIRVLISITSSSSASFGILALGLIFDITILHSPLLLLL